MPPAGDASVSKEAETLAGRSMSCGPGRPVGAGAPSPRHRGPQGRQAAVAYGPARLVGKRAASADEGGPAAAGTTVGPPARGGAKEGASSGGEGVPGAPDAAGAGRAPTWQIAPAAARWPRRVCLHGSEETRSPALGVVTAQRAPAGAAGHRGARPAAGGRPAHRLCATPARPAERPWPAALATRAFAPQTPACASPLAPSADGRPGENGRLPAPGSRCRRARRALVPVFTPAREDR